ncbi:twin-arginine translocase subunit TatC [Bacteroides ilei]|uniref:twin-arginine translocase subunit TatC n=1 Tax=Bacteroides ilei TaxID=1907658 RepID=UPI00093034AA|nr:twin-arginine translocase subunit TatC [Bacteroides ilei]
MVQGEEKQEEAMSFWEHLDVLRGSLVRMVLVTVICGLIAFLFKDEVFSIILAPKYDDFIVYRLFDRISKGLTGTGTSHFSVQLVNTGLAQQFIIHMKTSVYVGLLFASPYILYLLFRFVSPALYADERKYSVRVVTWGYVMFLLGVLLSYFLIFPLTFRFLGTYQVSEDVTNLITLDSYMSTLMTLNLAMGIIFELPLLCWLLAKLGLLKAGLMKRFRKQAFVAILVVAAIITPTSDAFTMLVVALPVWLLYEASILIVKHAYREKVF